MIKILPHRDIKYLLNMYNKIWEEGEIPKIWKHTTIAFLLKKGKYQKDVWSYRPVAQTKIPCIIFERMTNKRLVWCLEKEKIDDRQIGFSKQRSTTKVLNGFRRKKKTAAIFFDIKKL